MKVKSESEFAQSCLTLSDPMDCSPPGSSVHGNFQARVLEWVAIVFSEYIAYSILKSRDITLPTKVRLVKARKKEMATHSSNLAWKIPWVEEPGGLQSMGSTKSRA